MNETIREHDWWESFYIDTLADMFLVREDGNELEDTLEFLTHHLDIKPGSTVFDQCCGIGSLSIPLAQRGAKVVGVDLCENYIRRACQNAQSVGVSCEFHTEDAFRFVPGSPCDAVFNWWTSFGYARDDERNLQMLQRAFDALRPGGRFALDFPNMVYVFREFKDCMFRRHTGSGGEVLLIRETTINLAEGMLEQQWTYVMPDRQRVVRRSSVRLYLPHNLEELLRRCGFVDVEFFGDLRGDALTPQSQRCLCLARRP